jgi:hypothetical protein
MADAQPAASAPTNPGANFCDWTNHRIPEDRSGWHPMVRSFYKYWLSVAPPGRLPGRQHIRPEDLVPMLPRLWMLDVYRNPLRFRSRLADTQIVLSVGREFTGEWLDEVQPATVTNSMLRDRFGLSPRPVARRGGPDRFIGNAM